MNLKNVKTCLNGVEQDLTQDGGYEQAYVLLQKLVKDAVRHGYKQATLDLAVWNDGER